MNVSKIHTLKVSIYDKAGMLQVNRLSPDFASTSNGASLNQSGLKISPRDSLTHSDFEKELELAMNRPDKNQIDSHA